MYIQKIKLRYIFMLGQKKLILLKFKQQIMHSLNMSKNNIKRQIKLIFDLYKDNLKDVIDSNTNDKILGKNISLETFKLSALAF